MTMDTPPPLTREQVALALFANTAEETLTEAVKLHASKTKDYIQETMNDSFTLADWWIEVRDKQAAAKP
jgi:hypothetical protein